MAHRDASRTISRTKSWQLPTECQGLGWISIPTILFHVGDSFHRCPIFWMRRVRLSKLTQQLISPTTCCRRLHVPWDVNFILVPQVRLEQGCMALRLEILCPSLTLYLSAVLTLTSQGSQQTAIQLPLTHPSACFGAQGPGLLFTLAG